MQAFIAIETQFQIKLQRIQKSLLLNCRKMFHTRRGELITYDVVGASVSVNTCWSTWSDLVAEQ